jgi:chitinase
MSDTSSARPARRTRVSVLRVLVVLVAVAAAIWFGFKATVVAVVPPVTPGPSIFSPYVDVTAWPPYRFETPSGPADMDVTLAFIVADPAQACEPSWGGYYSLDAASSEIELDRRIKQLRTVGGDVRVSFGGAANDELAITCTNTNRLLDAYRAVVDRYELSIIDLDIEGSALSDDAANTRRAEAIALLQEEATAADRDLSVWLTLPVGPQGLTPEGERVVSGMLDAGVEVTGVNGMAMVFGLTTSTSNPQSDTIVDSALALQAQVTRLFGAAGQELNERDAWTKVGITVMIGQNDVETERFTLADAEVVNQFARDNGVGLVSMWSLNRDNTCTAPLPTVTTVLQDNCSGVDQGGVSFAETLSLDLPSPSKAGDADEPVASPSPSPSEAVAVPIAPADIVDDPAKSPYPIWEPLGTYPAGTKIVWRKNVYEARYWTSGFAPDTEVANPYDTPWTLLGPVMPGDKPAPLPTLPAGSYPDWDPEEVYLEGDRVLLDLVPYEAKWWTQGQKPGVAIEGGSPWLLVLPAG